MLDGWGMPSLKSGPVGIKIPISPAVDAALRHPHKLIPQSQPARVSETPLPHGTRDLIRFDLVLRKVPHAQDHDFVRTNCVHQPMRRFAADAEIELADFVAESAVFRSEGAALGIMFQRRRGLQEFIVPESRLFRRPVLGPPVVRGLRFTLGSATR
jgi:hypothetical protein